MSRQKDSLRAAVVLCARLLKKEILGAEGKIKTELKPRKKKRVWVRRRPDLFSEAGLDYAVAYRKVLGLTCDKFEELLTKVHPLVQKKDTLMRCAINSRTKLDIALRYLATGDTLQSLELLYGVSCSTISKFMQEVLDAVERVLSEYLGAPSTPQQWNHIIKEYETSFNFPNCAGAIGGRHIEIARPPRETCSMYINDLGTYSIILFALVDQSYNFKLADVNTEGRSDDIAAFNYSSLNRRLENNMLGLPNGAVVIGEDSFPLRTNLLTAYNWNTRVEREIVFNQKLTQIKRIVENAFGILQKRFCLLSRTINHCPERVGKIVYTACAIHNWLVQTSPTAYLPAELIKSESSSTGDVILGRWRGQAVSESNVPNLATFSLRNRHEAEKLRQRYADYFYEKQTVF